MSKAEITIHMMMDEVMAEWPETISVLLENNLHCVGCPLASFHDVSAAAYEHGLEQEELMNKLLAAKPKPSK